MFLATCLQQHIINGLLYRKAMEVLFESARVEQKDNEYVVLVDYRDEDGTKKTHQVFEAGASESNARLMVEEVREKSIEFFFQSTIDPKSVYWDECGLIIGCWVQGIVYAKINGSEEKIYYVHPYPNCIFICSAIRNKTLNICIP